MSGRDLRASVRAIPALLVDASVTCASNDQAGTSFSAGASSSPGNIRWFLVRPVTCGGNGSYVEIELTQQRSRDLEIQAGAWGCP